MGNKLDTENNLNKFKGIIPKGFVLVSLFLLALFFSPKKIFAFGPWIKYPSNPVLYGNYSGWDGRDTQCSTLLQEGGSFKIWYGGNSGAGWRIGYANSSVGTGSWMKSFDSVIDIGSSDPWEMDTTDPFVLHEETYKMWYSSIRFSPNSGPDRFRTRYATSTDEINWIEHDWVLRGTPGWWDSGGIARGFTILHTASGYQMWYAGVNEAPVGSPSERWQIGYATSPDGLNWTKYGPPVISPAESWELTSVSYPNVIFENGVYHMWYAATAINLPIQIIYAYSTDGINWTKPPDQNPALTLGPSGSFDSVYIASPFVIKVGNTYRMYYDGFNGQRWQIGLAEFTPPSPQPVVLIPGLGASWNNQFMLFGTEQPQSEWQMTPGVTVYNGFLQTLANQPHFVFNYNWTKPVDAIADDLKAYIDNVVTPPAGTKIDLVGHSLGGLVGRAYIQKYPSHPVDQLITVGSPHQGVPKVYYLWEGGDLVNGTDSWQRPLVSLLLHLRQPGFQTSASALQATAPVIKDLLPTLDYLKTTSSPIPVGSMIIRNNWLVGLNQETSPILHTIAGNIPTSTLRWITVQPRSWLDKALNLWPDGRPTVIKELGNGDKTVLTESAEYGTHTYRLENENHSELMMTSAGQKKILDILGLSSTISEGSQTELFPALVIQIASPANLTVDGFGEGPLIIIPKANSGIYYVRLTGTDSGNFKLHIGQLMENSDNWFVLAGKISTGQIIEYQINFDPNNLKVYPLVDPNGQKLLESIKHKLSSPIVSTLLVKNKIEEAIVLLYQIRRQNHSLEIQEIINDLEILYGLKMSGKQYSPVLLGSEITNAQKMLNQLENYLKIKPDIQKGAIYQLAFDKLTQARTLASHPSHIKALGAKYLAIEGLSIP